MSEYDTYIKSEFGELAGKTVLGVRALKQPEIEGLYWQDFDHKPAMVIIFTDGIEVSITHNVLKTLKWSIKNQNMKNYLDCFVQFILRCYTNTKNRVL